MIRLLNYILFISITTVLFSCSDNTENPVTAETSEIKVILNIDNLDNWPDNKSVVIKGFISEASAPVFQEALTIPGSPTSKLTVKIPGIKYNTFKLIQVVLLNNSSNSVQKILREFDNVVIDQPSIELTASGIDFKIDLSAYTFTMIQDEILTAKCVSCHSTSNPLGELDISKGKSYNNLVNKNSVYNPAYKLVVPHDSSGSYLYMTLIGKNQAPIMPPAPFNTLSAEEIKIIGLWIENGAPNN